MTLLDLSPNFSSVPVLRGPTILGNIGMTSNPLSNPLVDALTNPGRLALNPGPLGGYANPNGLPFSMGPVGSYGASVPQQVMGTMSSGAAPMTADLFPGASAAIKASAPNSGFVNSLSAVEGGAAPIVEQVAAQGGRTLPGVLGKFYANGALTGMGRLGVGVGVPIAANAILGPQLSQIEQEGGTGGAIAGGVHGAIKGSTIGLPLLMSGNPLAMAGGAGIIGVSSLLGAFHHSKKAADPMDQMDSLIATMGQGQSMDPMEVKYMQAMARQLHDTGIAPTDILQQLVLPKIQEQQAQQQQAQQMAAYQQQLQAYFTQQQNAIAAASGLSSIIAKPYIEQMRADAQNRRELVDQVLNQASGPKFTDAYKNTIRNSQGALANSLDSQAAAYAQAIQTAPYLAAQQEQANAYQQLMNQMQAQLQPTLLQPSYVQQQQQQYQQAALLQALQQQAKAGVQSQLGGSQSDLLAQLTGG